MNVDTSLHRVPLSRPSTCALPPTLQGRPHVNNTERTHRPNIKAASISVSPRHTHVDATCHHIMTQRDNCLYISPCKFSFTSFLDLMIFSIRDEGKWLEDTRIWPQSWCCSQPFGLEREDQTLALHAPLHSWPITTWSGDKCRIGGRIQTTLIWRWKGMDGKSFRTYLTICASFWRRDLEAIQKVRKTEREADKPSFLSLLKFIDIVLIKNINLLHQTL